MLCASQLVELKVVRLAHIQERLARIAYFILDDVVRIDAGFGLWRSRLQVGNQKALFHGLEYVAKPLHHGIVPLLVAPPLSVQVRIHRGCASCSSV
jgi:hypothetical protein